MGLGGECAWQVCKISVQGECARWEVPHMGMGGCCVFSHWLLLCSLWVVAEIQ